MRRALVLVSILSLGSGISSASGPTPKQPLTVAVLGFDVSGAGIDTLSLPVDVGNGVSDMMVTEIVTKGLFRVVERKRLAQVLAEQKLSHTAQFDAASAVKLGRMLGANAVLIGNVTRFGVERSTTAPSAAAAELYGGMAGMRKHVQKAVVGIDARMVDTSTGVIMAVAQGYAEDSKVAVTQSGGGRYPWMEPGSHPSFSDVTQSLVGNAARDAVIDVVSQLASNTVLKKESVVKGVVADVDGDQVIVNLGRTQGVDRGNLLVVERELRVVKDPTDPNKILRRLTTRVATLVVESADAGSSVCRVTGRVEGEAITIGSEVTLIKE